MYTRHSTATDVHLRVVPPVSQQTGTGRGTLIIPGWVRERAAEVLFEGGDVDESSVAEVILDALLKVAFFEFRPYFYIHPPLICLGSGRPPPNPGFFHPCRRRHTHATWLHSTSSR